MTVTATELLGFAFYLACIFSHLNGFRFKRQTHVKKRKQTREKVCGSYLNANSCNMQNQIFRKFAKLPPPPPPPPFSTEFSSLYMCCNIHHFGITKRKTRSYAYKTTSYAFKTYKFDS